MKKNKNTYLSKILLAFLMFSSTAEYAYARLSPAKKEDFLKKNGYMFISGLKNDTNFTFIFNDLLQDVKLEPRALLELPEKRCRTIKSVKTTTFADGILQAICDADWRIASSRTNELKILGGYDGWDKDGKPIKAKLGLRIEGETFHLVVIE